MKTQLVLVISIAVFSQGCAIIKGATSGNFKEAAAAAERLAKLLADSGNYGAEQCEPIKTSEIGLAEEKAVGSSMGVGLAMQSGAFFIDGQAERDGAKLNDDLAKGTKVSLPDSAKNDLTAYVSVVGRNLARYSERPDIAWTFGVYESEVPNAFSAPGGYVFVSTELLKRMENEAQLAGVLAHEIAHISHRHAMKAYKTAKHNQCVPALAAGYFADRDPENLPDELKKVLRFSKKFKPGGVIDLDAPDDTGFVPWVINKVLELTVLTGNAQEDEFEADATGLQLIAFAGYDTTEYEKFLTSLGNQGGWLDKHPSTADRVKKLKELREGELAPFCGGTAKPDVNKPFSVLSPKS